MGKRIALLTLLAFGSATSSVWALTADDYTVAARAALFERTYTGLLQVDDLFGAARGDTCCPECADDRELMLLHAVAQTAMLFVDYNDVLASEDLFRLAETFGIPLDGLAFGAEETQIARVRTDRCLPPTEASAEEVRQTLREVILPQLDVIISNLDALEDEPDPFVVYLVPEETGLANDLEIDYGDVLILKSLLSAYRGLLATRCAEDSGKVDADNPCSQSVLNATLGALIEPDGRTAFLSRARDDWVAALTWCLAAAEHMADEDGPTRADPQEDELVYIDPDAQPRLDAYRRTLDALRDSLVTGTDGVEKSVDRRTYDLRNGDSDRLGELTLVFDLTGFEGTKGRLTMADGTTLDIDWFGPLDEKRIGVSMYSGPAGLEGWLEVALDPERHLIHDGTLELWGRRSMTLAGLTGQASGRDVSPAQTDVPLAVSAVDEAPRSHVKLDRGGPWMGAGSVGFQHDRWFERWLEPLDLRACPSRL